VENRKAFSTEDIQATCLCGSVRSGFRAAARFFVGWCSGSVLLRGSLFPVAEKV